MNPAALVPVVLFLGACADSESSRGLEEHPVLDEVVADATTIVRSPQTPDSVSEPLRAAVERLREASEKTRFGAADNPAPYVFGDITDVAIVGDTVYVLDSGEVRLFTSEGLHIASFGSRGPGPNELDRPRDIEIQADGSIAVLETSGIKSFSIRNEQLVLDHLVIPTGARGGASACIWSDSLFVIRTQGLREEKQLHVFRSTRSPGEPEGTDIVTRFSDGYPLGGFLVRGRISRGPLACADRGIVMIAYHDLPLVEGFSVGGERLWQSALAEFDPERTFAGADSEGPFVRRNDDTARDRVQTLTTLPGGFALLQVARLSATARDTPNAGYTIDSYVLEVDSGMGAFVGDNLPWIMAATEALLVGAEMTPDFIPQILIWDY